MTPDAALLREASLARLTGAGVATALPEAVGQKFDAKGQVLPFPGNTFLCHIPPDGPAHAALCAASAALQAGPLAGAFSFLPPASFHMTVFEGVTDAHRDDARWPEGLPADAALDEVTARFAAATAGLELPPAQAVRPVAILGGRTVAVTGLTAQAEAALRAARAILADRTGIRRPDFATYGFHITLAYALRWLTEDEARAVHDLSDAVFARLVAAAPAITLGPVEFCTFADMHAFPPLQLLTGGAGTR
ncbi:MAG: DUF1868 domain-containing protein [Rhodobacterales bacterium]|nr:MAG: DUF1868 domain-containing protein [Rhodobacterales bacterium]